MRNNRIALFALALIASASAGAAPSSTHHAFQPISTQKMHDVRGEYRLSNGHRVSLVVSDNRLYAVLGKRDRHELVATGDNTFVARDRSISVQFKPDTNGDELVLTSTDSAAGRERSLARVFEEAQRDRQAALSTQRSR